MNASLAGRERGTSQSVRRSEWLGGWIFWGMILCFEALGVFLANHPQWSAEDMADEDVPTMSAILVTEETSDEPLMLSSDAGPTTAVRSQPQSRHPIFFSRRL
jgi:hypothetical protein